MNPELREHVHLLLQRESTRSLALPLLRERLRPVAPGPALADGVLRQVLLADPRIRVLDPPAPDPATAKSLRELGIMPETRVVLLDSLDPDAESPLETTRTQLLELLERQPGLQGEVAQALGELAQLSELLEPASSVPGDQLRGDTAARSTSPPRAPRARRQSRRGRTPPA